MRGTNIKQVRSIEMFTKPIVITGVIIMSLASMTGCGQKGDLYLPEAEDSQALIEASKSDSRSAGDEVLAPQTEQQIIENPNDY